MALPMFTARLCCWSVTFTRLGLPTAAAKAPRVNTS